MQNRFEKHHIKLLKMQKLDFEAQDEDSSQDELFEIMRKKNLEITSINKETHIEIGDFDYLVSIETDTQDLIINRD